MNRYNSKTIILLSLLGLLLFFFAMFLVLRLNTKDGTDVSVAGQGCPSIPNAQFRVGSTGAWVSGTDITAKNLTTPINNFQINCFRDNGSGVIDYGSVKLIGPNNFSSNYNRPDVTGVILSASGTYIATCYAQNGEVCDSDSFTVGGSTGGNAATCGNNICEVGEADVRDCKNCDDPNQLCPDSVCTVTNGTCVADCISTGGYASNLKNCGPMDINLDGYFNIIDFSNFAKYYNKTCPKAD